MMMISTLLGRSPSQARSKLLHTQHEIHHCTHRASFLLFPTGMRGGTLTAVRSSNSSLETSSTFLSTSASLLRLTSPSSSSSLMPPSKIPSTPASMSPILSSSTSYMRGRSVKCPPCTLSSQPPYQNHHLHHEYYQRNPHKPSYTFQRRKYYSGESAAGLEALLMGETDKKYDDFMKSSLEGVVVASSESLVKVRGLTNANIGAIVSIHSSERSVEARSEQILPSLGVCGVVLALEEDGVVIGSIGVPSSPPSSKSSPSSSPSSSSSSASTSKVPFPFWRMHPYREAPPVGSRALLVQPVSNYIPQALLAQLACLLEENPRSQPPATPSSRLMSPSSHTPSPTSSTPSYSSKFSSTTRPPVEAIESLHGFRVYSPWELMGLDLSPSSLAARTQSPSASPAPLSYFSIFSLPEPSTLSPSPQSFSSTRRIMHTGISSIDILCPLLEGQSIMLSGLPDGRRELLVSNLVRNILLDNDSEGFSLSRINSLSLSNAPSSPSTSSPLSPSSLSTSSLSPSSAYPPSSAPLIVLSTLKTASELGKLLETLSAALMASHAHHNSRLHKQSSLSLNENIFIVAADREKDTHTTQYILYLSSLHLINFLRRAQPFRPILHIIHDMTDHGSVAHQLASEMRDLLHTPSKYSSTSSPFSSHSSSSASSSSPSVPFIAGSGSAATSILPLSLAQLYGYLFSGATDIPTSNDNLYSISTPSCHNTPIGINTTICLANRIIPVSSPSFPSLSDHLPMSSLASFSSESSTSLMSSSALWGPQGSLQSSILSADRELRFDSPSRQGVSYPGVDWISHLPSLPCFPISFSSFPPSEISSAFESSSSPSPPSPSSPSSSPPSPSSLSSLSGKLVSRRQVGDEILRMSAIEFIENLKKAKECHREQRERQRLGIHVDFWEEEEVWSVIVMSRVFLNQSIHSNFSLVESFFLLRASTVLFSFYPLSQSHTPSHKTARKNTRTGEADFFHGGDLGYLTSDQNDGVENAVNEFRVSLLQRLKVEQPAVVEMVRCVLHHANETSKTHTDRSIDGSKENSDDHSSKKDTSLTVRKSKYDDAFLKEAQKDYCHIFLDLVDRTLKSYVNDFTLTRLPNQI